MKKIVVSLAIGVDDDAERDRAADIASRLVRRWSADAPASAGITLLSARWEAEPDPAAGPGYLGSASGG